LIQGELVNGSVGQVIAFSTAYEAQKNRTEIAQVADTKDSSAAHVIPNRVAQNDRVWPVVRFTSGRVMLIVPVEFTVNNAQGGTEAAREQVRFIYPPIYHLTWPIADSTDPCMGFEYT
jgi:phosphoribosylamine-glycine ligase